MRCAAIAAVRGAGLYFGVDIAAEGAAPASGRVGRALNGMCDRHVMIGAAGLNGVTLKIRPSLIFEQRHADRLLDALEATLRVL